MRKKILKNFLNNYLVFLFFIFFSGCSSFEKKNYPLADQRSYYSYQDATGSFLLERQIKISKNNLILRSKLFKNNIGEDPLEETISISILGKSKKNNLMKPSVTQFTTWLDKEKHFVQHKTNNKTKTLETILDGPRSYKGKSIKAFPKNRVFCFFSVLPECLGYYGLLQKNLKPHNLVVIMDGYPYVKEQYGAIPDTVFIASQLVYDGKFEGLHRFLLSLGNQTISYHFDNEMRFEKMFWIAQSLSVEKQR